jgi:uncharacterized membrane protein (DUF485 family)
MEGGVQLIRPTSQHGAAGAVRASSSLGLLEKRRSQLVVPLFVLSFGLFLATLLVLSYWPALVSLQVAESINVAYVLALLQFLTTFSIAILYALVARHAIDPLVVQALNEIQR